MPCGACLQPFGILSAANQGLMRKKLQDWNSGPLNSYQKAHALGADAILGIRWDYSYVGRDRWSLVMLVATGTACRVRE